MLFHVFFEWIFSLHTLETISVKGQSRNAVDDVFIVVWEWDFEAGVHAEKFLRHGMTRFNIRKG